MTKATSTHSTPRILVVDDDWLNHDLLDGILSTQDYTTLKARNGESALKIARQERPALIILDVRLPGMSGFDVCRAVKETPETADIPVLMMTGHKTNEAALEAQHAGADAFIERSTSVDHLLDHINRLLA